MDRHRADCTKEINEHNRDFNRMIEDGFDFKCPVLFLEGTLTRATVTALPASYQRTPQIEVEFRAEDGSKYRMSNRRRMFDMRAEYLEFRPDDMTDEEWETDFILYRKEPFSAESEVNLKLYFYSSATHYTGELEKFERSDILIRCTGKDDGMNYDIRVNYANRQVTVVRRNPDDTFCSLPKQLEHGRIRIKDGFEHCKYYKR